MARYHSLEPLSIIWRPLCDCPYAGLLADRGHCAGPLQDAAGFVLSAKTPAADGPPGLFDLCDLCPGHGAHAQQRRSYDLAERQTRCAIAFHPGNWSSGNRRLTAGNLRRDSFLGRTQPVVLGKSLEPAGHALHYRLGLVRHSLEPGEFQYELLKQITQLPGLKITPNPLKTKGE